MRKSICLAITLVYFNKINSGIHDYRNYIHQYLYVLNKRELTKKNPFPK